MLIKIKKIAFYDHDGTLMDVPMPDTGRNKWKEKTGADYPHKGWWGQPDSLNLDVFDIMPFPEVEKLLRQDIADPATMTVLLTNRIPKIQEKVMVLLEKHGIKLDSYSFKTDEKSKKDRIVDYLTKYTDIEEVTVYDDQDDQIEILRKFYAEHAHSKKIAIYQVINGVPKLVDCLAPTV